MEAISIKKLTKTYQQGNMALDDLSLSVKSGEIFSLLGPNGAGKSTLINILTTYLQPTSGQVRILGKDLTENLNFVRTQIACVAQKSSIDDHLSLYENMLFQSRLYKLDKTTAKARIKTLIQAFGLQEYVGFRVSAYSGGVKRRLDIAMSMISNPRILFLDEPTVGMDIESRKSMWDMVKRIQHEFKTTVFLTTHYLEEADLLSDTICIIKDGHELVQNSPKNLRQYTQQDIIKISLYSLAEQSAFVQAIKSLSFVRGVRNDEKSILVQVEDSKRDFTVMNQFALDNAVCFDSIEIVKPSLNDIFLVLTQADERSAS